ncbi:putative NEK/NEK6 protein kinase [Blattamonas nauphoetae]|uniref:non-specific serine/threonine protein kinase n=1 Tax=Blattamonas nauphoetae TaxID=2049346 RepID=A0ABQ9XT14_9EUKA|nr:putative NEK/NEK6 protein kinase [Blattamonas nauphoetae]
MGQISHRPNRRLDIGLDNPTSTGHSLTGQVEYAMKVLPMLKEGDKEKVSREVEMLTRFAHPRIVRLHESIDMGGHQAIVMELGTRSLKDLISEFEERKELIPLPLMVMILMDICEGLLWMHTHSSGSTAHGDLKPENVLLRWNNRAFLCDLGGSAPLSQQTSTIGEMGTFEYNSPERVMDSKGMATLASDVWSLGVLAYRMVTGRPLFEDLTLPQLCRALDHFSESMIPTTIPASMRDVLLKMLEPNVALRASAAALFEGGLLERLLGPETALSKMKNLQFATRVNEIKESANDAKVKEKTMELEMEKEKLLEETQELARQLRSVQLSLHRTCERNDELEKEEDLERRHNLLITHTSPISIPLEDNILSTKHTMPNLLFAKEIFRVLKDGKHCFNVFDNTITRTHDGRTQKWSSTLFGDIISEGVVSLAITLLAMPTPQSSAPGLMFGLVDALSRSIDHEDQLGENVPNSIAYDPKKGTLHTAIPSTNLQEKQWIISPRMSEGDRMLLEVDMDARPRTAVFIINGNVPLTFVSGLPPSIRFGLSMKQEGVSVRFDGLSRLKQATPLRRVHEIKWNRPELTDRQDLYMNGMRSSVLTIQTQMPSLVFTDHSHFRVEDNRIACTGQAIKIKAKGFKHIWSSFFIAEPITEGIVAISFTYLMRTSEYSGVVFGLIDGKSSIPIIGQTLGWVENSIALSSEGHLNLGDSLRKIAKH